MAKTPHPWFRKGRGWFVTLNGKQHNLGRNKQAAFQEFYRLMQTPAEHQRVPGRSMAALIDDYLEFVKRNRSPATYRWYLDLLQKFIVLHKDLTVDDIRPYHVQRWVDGYPHLAKTSRRNYFRSVKRCMKWATSQGYIDRNPLEHMSIPAGERKEVFVTQAEFEQMLQYATPDSIRDLLITTWESGCRPQESLRVQARHVDLVNQRWIIPPSESKGERMTRIVYLTDKAFEITRRLMKQFPQGNLFRNTNGNPWNAQGVNCAIDRIRIRIGTLEMKRRGLTIDKDQVESLMPLLPPTRRVKGVVRRKTEAELRCRARVKLTEKLAKSLVPRYSLYALRHAFATHALQRGVDSVTVAVLLGHSDPSMLAKVYQHLTQNPKFLLEQTKKATASNGYAAG